MHGEAQTSGLSNKNEANFYGAHSKEVESFLILFKVYPKFFSSPFIYCNFQSFSILSIYFFQFLVIWLKALITNIVFTLILLLTVSYTNLRKDTTFW
jgi:hypothetical protein